MKYVKKILSFFFMAILIISSTLFAFASEPFYEYTPPKWSEKVDSFTKNFEEILYTYDIWQSKKYNDEYRIVLEVRDIEKNSMILTKEDTSIAGLADEIVKDTLSSLEDKEVFDKITEKHDYSVEEIGNYLAVRVNAVFTLYVDDFSTDIEFTTVMYNSANHLFVFMYTGTCERDLNYNQAFIESLETFTINEELAHKSIFGTINTDNMITDMTAAFIVSIIATIIGTVRNRKKNGVKYTKNTKNFTGFEE